MNHLKARMNISRKNLDELNAVVTVTIEKEDYAEKVENTLRDYRRKARVDGFRPGKVPQGLISKLYRKPVLVDEVNKILGESLSKFLSEQPLNVLGEPLPNLEKPVSIDWDSDETFEFAFDIGLAPEVDFTVTEKDKIVRYKISIDEKDIDKQVEAIRKRYGRIEDADETDGDSTLKVRLEETDSKGNVVPEGKRVEETSLSIEFIQDNKIRKQFLGKKVQETLVMNAKKAFTNEADLAAMLNLQREELAGAPAEYQVTVLHISRFVMADLNQELFDKVYGEGSVSTVEGFRDQVKEEISKAYEQSSEFRFTQDAKAYYLSKFKQELPAAFLKRWLLHTNEGKLTSEEVDKDFEQFSEDLRWQLVKSRLIRFHNLSYTEDELLSFAAGSIRQQFVRYYGVASVPADLLAKYAQENLADEPQRNRYVEGLMENKLFDFIRNTVKLDTKDVTLEKFNTLFEKQAREKK
jgi:trigger factor